LYYSFLTIRTDLSDECCYAQGLAMKPLQQIKY